MLTELDIKILARFDPVVFSREYLHFYPYPSQEEILRSTSKRLALNCCRQYGKTSLAGIKALWYAAYHPGSLVLIVAKAERQAQELLLKCRQMGLLVKEISFSSESRTHLELGNGARIISLPSSSGGIRGYSAPDIVICDEASRVEDSVFIALRPMLLSGGTMILLSTPYLRQGYYWEVWENDPDWEKHRVDVYSHPGADADFIAQEQRSLPAHHFKAEYMCEFIDNASLVFSQEALDALFTSGEPLFNQDVLTREVAPLDV